MITTSCKNFPYLKCEDNWLFDAISNQFDHSKAYVDIRMTTLKMGETPGTGLWHFDSYDGEADTCGTTNFLWVSGVSVTEFEDGTFIKPGVWRRYGAEMHRASPAYKSGKRLMLRVLELDRKPKHSYKKRVNNV